MAKKTDGTTKLTTVAAPGALGYEVGPWAGQNQYRCKQCAFDTLDPGGLDRMIEHLVQTHSAVARLQEIPPEAQGDSINPTEGERADGIYEVDLKEVGND